MTYTNPPVEDRWASAIDLATASTAVIPLMSAMGTSTRRVIESVSVGNLHATVNNVVRILSGTRLVDTVTVQPNGGTATHTFNPALPCDVNAAVNFQGISAAATFIAVQGFNIKG